jgi:glycosidase
MPASLFDSEVIGLLDPATLAASGVRITPSPSDWRDHWIYFLLVDRFNNPVAPPTPSTFPCDTYQGGSFAGIKEKLPYLKGLGVGALWISPVLYNAQWFGNYWGGYGITDFLRIEPRFCSDRVKATNDPEEADREFRDLVDAAHDEGLYVILDIVLNHVGDPFNYEGMRDSCPWRENGEYASFWRDKDGTPKGDWTTVESISDLSRANGIWPKDFQHNGYFRRKGSVNEQGDITRGDFDRLKELVTEYLEGGITKYPVRNNLIRSYQYLIAKFDLDGFRIDTLQYVEPDFARVFGNAIREFALSIGKQNFFTFGEVWQDSNEDAIARFIGRNTLKDDELVGVDAAIDFPIRRRLWDVIKCSAPPRALAEQFDERRRVLRTIVSSQGDAGKNYVTFLDNHDINERFHQSSWPKQSRIALLCLLTLQGVPCLYYGHEQGLEGSGDRREYARGALWGYPGAFNTTNPLYSFLRDVSDLRDKQPALRYGRQYFRPIGDGTSDQFGYSPYNQGVLGFSRILNDREILVVVNTHTSASLSVSVVVDASLHPLTTSTGAPANPWILLFSTSNSSAGDPPATPPSPTRAFGATRAVVVNLQPMEGQVLTGPMA